MKKIMLLCSVTDVEESLTTLQRLGVVHVIHEQTPGGEELDEARQMLEPVNQALGVLGSPRDGSGLEASPEELVNKVLALTQQIHELKEKQEALELDVERIKPFGSFDPGSVEDLEEMDVFIGLYKCESRKSFVVPDDLICMEMHRNKNTTYYAVIGTREPELDAINVPLPESSLEDLRAELEETEHTITAYENRLDQFGTQYQRIKDYAGVLEDRVLFLETRTGMRRSGPVAALSGYCPKDACPAIVGAAEEKGWGYSFSDPAPDEAVPTLIRNPKWVNLIKPIMDFIGIVPGYREVDISACFLLFFSVFFGMIVGDAGYGLIFLVGAIFARIKFKNLPKIMTSMVLVMSISTIAWGALTGNYFGINPEFLSAPLASFRLEWLGNESNLMYICFLIGAIHLTIAHTWKALRSLKSAAFLAQVGWICTTWVMFFAARNMILGHEFPSVMMKLLIVGVALIVLFMTPLKNLKSEWFNHLVLPLDLVSNFVDVVSYVRLYAVGMATFAVASAFNEMALGIGFGGVLSGLGAGLILFFGHVLNIALATMGVLVHGIRLNALEFSSHLGMEWSGFPYSPFCKKTEP